MPPLSRRSLLRSSPSAALLLLGLAGCSAETGPLSFAWPPVEGQAYPDLVLRDFRGEPVQLSSFRGKVLLIEPIGMT